MFSFSSNTIHPAGRGLPASERLGALLAVMLAVCMASLDTAIANTALPTMMQESVRATTSAIAVMIRLDFFMLSHLRFRLMGSV